MKPHERRAEILFHAVNVARSLGFVDMTREDIAKAAGVTGGLVSARLGKMEKVRVLVMQEAVKREDLEVIAMGIAARHRDALRAPKELQARAVATLVR